MVNGFPQDPIDGVSFVSTFGNSHASEVKQTQYFDNNGSRGIYHDGWYACAFGPLVPWLPGAPGIDWDANTDQWELYHLTRTSRKPMILPPKNPSALRELQKVFDAQAKANKVYPLGAGIWLRLHPEDRIKTPYSSWIFDAPPRACRSSPRRVSDARATSWPSKPSSATALRRPLCPRRCLRRRHLLPGSGPTDYEYNMIIIERTRRQDERRFPPANTNRGCDYIRHNKPLAPAEVVIKVDGKEAARTTVKRTVPAAFTPSESFDIGVDLGVARRPGIRSTQAL